MSEVQPRPGWWRRWRRYDRYRATLEALSEAIESDRLSPDERINAEWQRSFLRMTHAGPCDENRIARLNRQFAEISTTLKGTAT